MSSGGVYLYRATADCSACGRSVDVGPFDSMVEAVADQLPGWLLPSAMGPHWVLADGFGARMTLCDDCMGRPLRVTLAAITERNRP